MISRSFARFSKHTTVFTRIFGGHRVKAMPKSLSVAVDAKESWDEVRTPHFSSVNTKILKFLSEELSKTKCTLEITTAQYMEALHVVEVVVKAVVVVTEERWESKAQPPLTNGRMISLPPKKR